MRLIQWFYFLILFYNGFHEREWRHHSASSDLHRAVCKVMLRCAVRLTHRKSTVVPPIRAPGNQGFSHRTTRSPARITSPQPCSCSSSWAVSWAWTQKVIKNGLSYITNLLCWRQCPLGKNRNSYLNIQSFYSVIFLVNIWGAQAMTFNLPNSSNRFICALLEAAKECFIEFNKISQLAPMRFTPICPCLQS